MVINSSVLPAFELKLSSVCKGFSQQLFENHHVGYEIMLNDRLWLLSKCLRFFYIFFYFCVVHSGLIVQSYDASNMNNLLVRLCSVNLQNTCHANCYLWNGINCVTLPYICFSFKGVETHKATEQYIKHCSIHNLTLR